ncbi:beta-1,4-N-acetylgalactosaminyltransferase bre-4-like [Galleria mellonella]|uniref:Beta-1,4-N-acetylgalactosaminyltransferase n=1 Tax=Galleria mellonella TaxID=7137 RepID=A0A6J3BW39_GALME|nr:beta-1,4-N-acetylgalactosaminyltransferase bre-4-like [Galleria mellonella]XP_026756311.1 beta-1,4-N-acetylgalactosaminyltransferase bre-4-like [Galleria mellonella]XP_031764612.1 beta-1,4-N-acetylgalactosaminyltransferase bre-4-like [Galleria mellonella]XP_052751183.1 beta-1,4-N-acetylgalactosaminyltransferase bre-4-like [Galleria mellonella]
MGGSGNGGGGRAARALRFLLLFVLALAAVEYLSGSILDASPLRTYLYTPLYNATQPTIRCSDKTSVQRPKNSTYAKNVTVSPNTVKYNATNITATNMTRQDSTEDTSTSVLISKLMDNIKNLVTTEEVDVKKTEPALPLCDKLPPDLGPIPVNKTEVELEWVEKKYPEVHWGGRYSPPNCTARYKVAIIVPFRDRQQHLAIFLNHMHPFLMKQQIEYGIFIVEQEGNSEFNRAKLMNVGFMESQKQKAGGWECFIFHDIDLLPLDLRNMYSCPRQPRHMSASIDKLNFKLPYEDIFGGVSAMTLEQFVKVNGFSNKYWGWGGEDDDMFYRLKKMNYHIARYKMSIARYAMLDHKKSAPNPKRYQLLSQTSKIFQNDGLSTLEYELVEIVQNHLYTHILANIDERS